MINKVNEPEKKELTSGFAMLDNRLLAKKDITIEQKVLLTIVIGFMKTTQRFNASNDYITGITGFNKKTISKAFTVFHDRRWLYHQVIPGGGRKVHFNNEHKANLKKYLGTVEEYKKFLESLKKSYELDDRTNTTLNDVERVPAKSGPSPKPQVTKINNIPPVAASEKVIEGQQLTSIYDSDEEIPDDLVTSGDLFSLNDGNVEPETTFGEPDTIEYLFYGTWFPINNSIVEEIKILRRYFEGVTADLIKSACEGEDVDTGEFQFRYKQKVSA